MLFTLFLLFWINVISISLPAKTKNVTAPRTTETSWKTTLASQRKAHYHTTLFTCTDVHTCSEAQRLGPIKAQDTGEQSACWWNGLEGSQLGMGKHADSLALITEALNLSSTHTHKQTKTHEYTKWNADTLSPQRPRQDWTTAIHTGNIYSKMGGLLAKDSFCCLKYQNWKRPGQLALSLHKKTEKKCNKRARNDAIKRFKRDLKGFSLDLSVCFWQWLKCVL